MVKVIVWLSRILLGGVFIFSGFVKAIDPLGSAYKFQDYFMAFGAEWLLFSALPLAILLSTLEFVIGAGVLIGFRMRLNAPGGLLFMAFFTPLTLFIAITDPVPDCGCFGDAIIISNWETFYKNIFILLAAIIVYAYRNKITPPWGKLADNALLVAATIGVLWLSVYCIRNLPVIDFRPWKVGSDITQLVISTPETTAVYLIFKHKQTGERREYPSHDYPWNDPEFIENWQYVDQRREIISPAIEAPIENFYIENEFGDDLTEMYITEPGHLFIVVVPDLMRTNTSAFHKRIASLADAATAQGHLFIGLTGSPYSAVEAFTAEHDISFPIYLSDEIELKTIIRSSPGLVLMKNGTVKGKWAHRNIPTFEKIREEVMERDQ